MWLTSEFDDLAVWADDLQRRGDRWGELVTTSLAAEACEHPEQRVQLDARVAELERDVLQARMQPLLDGFTGIRPTWKHGVLVDLRVVERGQESVTPVLERVAALLRLPAARFLWSLSVELWTPTWSSLDLVPLLLEPQTIARPRMLFFNSEFRLLDRRVPVDRFGEEVMRITEPARGLLALSINQGSIELPWARGDGVSRLRAFSRLDARIRAAPTRLTTPDRTAFARALWDRSLRVRLAALDCLGEIGVEAAPLIPDLLQVKQGPKEWHERALEVLTKLREQPEVVARVAENFVANQYGVWRWVSP